MESEIDTISILTVINIPPYNFKFFIQNREGGNFIDCSI